MLPDPALWAGRRVLLTGHTGFKGAWLALWLRELGAEVAGLALAPPTTPSLFELAGVARDLTDHRGDVRDPATVDAAFAASRPEVVLHLAAQALVRPSYADPVYTFGSNVMGTVHVLDAARRCPSVRAVVVVTSDKCYDNREWPWGYREPEPMGGRDPYSASKGCAELVTAAWRHSFCAKGPWIASARAGNVFGGGDWATDRLVPDLVGAFLRGEPALVRRPAAVRPWQHVLEPLAGYLLLAERLWVEGAACAQAFNFGPAAESELPVLRVAQLLQAVWPGAQLEVAKVAEGPHEAGLLRLDASLARARLNWRPRLGLAEALAWTAQWYRQFATDPGQMRERTIDQIRRYQAIG
ncbi:MAG: CDP-glucose 4,6-dehydratase [Deltaproteobacteria bacterium]|nr:CDP-glucose 4,6-dehydratase [Deltaproteobacteria bacterium]